MPPLTALERYTQALERWVDDQLSDYNERLAARADGELATPKEINDPIWGTVDLSAAEVVVIDSPVFQRLRRIRQLGVVDLVYPSALHTRFEHSLGVTHLIGRMARSLQRHAPDDVTIDPSDVALLRMAALCHDIGHGTMSHVSERALKSLPAAEDACLQLARSLPVEKVELAEAASYVIVQSPAFQDLLRHAKRVAHDTDLSVNFHEEVAPLIVGKPVRERWPMMQELVSGPFDADKLDYITRDAVMSGVPVVADTVRLIEKLRLVALSQDELPERIARVAVGNHPAYYLFGVALSGGRTIDELMLGRTFLHDKLYRHHKVRSLEAMVGAVLELLAESNPDRALLLPYLLGDDAVVQLDEGELGRHGLEIANETARRTTLDISRRVGERRIFTRAYAFAKFMPSDPYRSDDEHATGLREAITACQEPDSRVEIERRCAELVLDAMKRLGLEVDGFDQLAPDELRRYLRIDPPQASTQSSQFAKALLVSPDRTVHAYSEYFSPASNWTNAYLYTRDLGYLFAPEEIADLAHLAMERLLRVEFSVRTPRSMHSYAKRDVQRVEELRRRLADAGYYENAPRDLRPRPAFLEPVRAKQLGASFVTRLHGYSGPAREPGKGTLLDVQRVVDWAAQFPEKFGEDVFRVIEHLHMIGRPEIGQLVARVRAQVDGPIAGVAPLGGPKDSGVIAAYYAGDRAEVDGIEVVDLATALTRDGTLVLVDDFIGSGSQSIDIVEAALGAERTTGLGEVREALTDEMCRSLLDRSVHFAFAAGLAAGRERLEGRCAELGLDATVTIGTEQLPSLESAGATPEFVEWCRAAGEQLLRSTQDWDADPHKYVERALGYGNHGFLMTFPYNTPTQALTVLWSDGEVDGDPWMPLLPRRKKR